MSSLNPPRFPPLSKLSFRPRPGTQKDPDDEQDGMAKSLGSYAQTGLTGALHVLDTPGSIVRGGIGHLIGARASDGERTSGRDLTNAIGLTSKHSKSWLSGGLGLGVDILTDPLTYLTFGTHAALTGAGKALAKSGATRGLSRRAMLEGFHGLESAHIAASLKAGKTADQAASALTHVRNQGKRIATQAQEDAVLKATGLPLQPKQPLGALAGIGLPFRDPSILLGTGAGARKIAGGLDKIGDKLKYGNSFGRGFNALFDPAVNEAVGAASQRAYSQHGRPALEAAKAASKNEVYGVVHGIDEAIKSGLPEADVLRAARQGAEGASTRNASPGVLAAAQPVSDLVRRSGDARLAEAKRLGLPLTDLADQFIGHVPRSGVDLASARQVAASSSPVRIGVHSGPGGNLPLTSSANLHREGAYRDIPGGTERINAWAMQHGGDPAGLGVRGVRRGVLRDMVAEIQATGSPITRDVIRTLGSKADVVAKKLVKLDPAHSEHGIGIFSPNIVADIGRAGESQARTVASAKAVFGLLGDHARPAASLGADSVPVSQVLKRIGLKTTPADAATASPIQGALVQALRSLAKQGAGPVDRHLMGSTRGLRRAVDRFAVSKDIADEILASHAKWSTPEIAKGPMGLFDGTTALFKSLAYPLWPASHFRNAVGAGLNNALSGTSLADHVLSFKIMRGTASAAEIRKALPGLPAGISDDAARDLVRREQHVHAGLYDGGTGALDLDTAAKLQSQIPGRTTPNVPGSDLTGSGNFVQDTAGLIGGGIKDQAGAIAEKAKHPWTGRSPIEVAGAFGGLKDFPALETGRKVGGNVEDLFRGANWLGSRRAGYDAATAGRMTRDLHFDYGDLTNFEKNVMRRLFPFYTYGSRNLPMQARRLMSTPGSTVAQLRAMSAGNDPSDPLPTSLSGGLTIPTGSSDGKRQYISGFGLPLEEALSRVPFKGGLPDAHGSAMSYAAGLNPLIKGPLEQLAGIDLFTGRKLSDLQPSGTASALGRLMGDDNPRLLSRVLANTPATRFVSTLDRMLDDRKSAGVKALALASGLRLQDVDLDKARRGDEARARDELMASSPRLHAYTNYGIRPGEKGNLTPEEMALLRSAALARQDSRERAHPARIGLMVRRPGE